MKNLQSLSHLLRAVRVALFTPTSDGWGIPVYVEGPPGSAKTKIARQLARRFGMSLQLLSPGLHGDGAFGAVPVPVNVNGETRITYPSPAWVDRFAGNSAGLLFVDELTTAPPQLQPALLGLVNERRVGFEYLGPRVRVLAAGNPAAYAANGNDLNPAQANRMAHFAWTVPSSEDFSAYLTGCAFPEPGAVVAAEVDPDDLGVEEDAEALERRVRDGWAAQYPVVAGLVGAFLCARSALLHKMPAYEDENASKAWPSHRTWEFAVQAMVAGAILSDAEAGDWLAAALVGPGAFTEFAAYRRELDLPDVAAVLDGRATFAHSGERADRTLAFLSTATALVAPKGAENRDARAVALWGIVGAIQESEPDLVAATMRTLCSTPVGLGYSAHATVREAAKRAMPGLFKADDARNAAIERARAAQSAPQGTARSTK